MVIAALLLAAASLGGAVLTYLYDDEAPLGMRLWAGSCVGMALLGLLGFVLAMAVGLNARSTALATLGMISPTALLLRGGIRDRVRRDLARTVKGLGSFQMCTGARLGAWLFYALLFVTLSCAFHRAMVVGPDGIRTGLDHNLGDLPFHLAVINGFALGNNVPPEHPEFSGTRLTYPFLVDFVAAMLLRVGATGREALFLQNLLLLAACLGLLHGWGSRLTRDPLATLAIPLLVFFSGGFGFLMLFRDVDPRAGGLLGLLRHLPHDYTILPYGANDMPGYLRWGNVVTTLLIPQRSLLLGLPLFLHVSTLWWQELSPGGKAGSNRRRMIAAGAVAGLLPLCHAHTFVVVVLAGLCLAIRERRHSWGLFFAVTLATALPQLLWLARGSAVEATRFIAWRAGWDRGGEGAVGFWLWNAGLFIPLLLVAISWGRARGAIPATLLRRLAPFMLFFVVPNLVKLSPWVWDNIKFLVYWYVASTPLVALLLAHLWRRGGVWRWTSAAALFFATLSGALDVWRVASGSVSHRVFSREAVDFAREIVRVTPPRALVLARPSHDSPVFLTGRRSLLGYPGHIWSQGLDAGEREEEIRRIYLGADDAAELLARHGVDFILVGPRERKEWPASEASLADHTLVVKTEDYVLYRVRRP